MKAVRLHVGAWAILALTMSAGCSVSRTFQVILDDAPPSGGWYAVLAIGLDEAIVGATGLTPADPTATYVFPESTEVPHHYELLWFDPAALDRVGPLPSPTELHRAHLRAATPTDPILPDTPWRRRLDPQADVLLPAAELPQGRELTASWLAPCPRLLGDGATRLLDVGCVVGDCPARIAQEECTLLVDLSDCGKAPIRARIDPRGHLEFHDAGGYAECHAAPAPPPAQLRVRCDEQCNIDLYEESAALPIVVQTTTVVDALPRPSNFTRPLSGYTNAMTLLGDELVIATRGGDFGSPLYCEPIEANPELLFVSIDTQRIVRRVPAPHCISALIPDPNQPGSLLATLTSVDAPRIARFAPESGWTTATLQADPPLAPRMLPLTILDVGDGYYVVVFRSPPPGNPPPELGTRVVRYRGLGEAPYGPGAPLTVGRDAYVAVSAHLAAGRLYLLDDDYDELVALGPQTLSLEGRLALRGACGVGGGAAPATLRHDLPRDRLLLANTDPATPALTWVAPNLPSGSCGAANFYPTAASAWSLLPYGQDRTLVVLASNDARERVALGLFDEANDRFLPGLVTLDVPGATGPAVVDSAGRGWLLQPPSGRLLRVAPPE